MFSIPWQFPELLYPRYYRRALSERVGRWARKRQGHDAAITTLRSGRLYILPSGVGLIFALTCFAMLLGSMNYNNNLSFVLTFLLAGLGLVAMYQCQRNLIGLEIRFAGVEPVHAGQAAEFRIAVRNRSRSRRFHIQMYANNVVGDNAASGNVTSDIDDIAPGESRVFHLELPTQRRGTLTLPRFGIRTGFPFELFGAWAWLHMDLQALVWPRQAERAPAPPAALAATGHRQHDARGEEDFAGLRKYHSGDSPRQVAWKAYARGGDLLSKQFAGADTSSQWFDFEDIETAGVEERLEILTRWIMDAEREQRDYGLRLPGATFAPAHGESHRHRCLRALALFDGGVNA